MTAPRPLNWDWLPKLTPSQEILLARASRWKPRQRPLELEALAPSLGCPLEIDVRELDPFDNARARGRQLQLVALELTDNPRGHPLYVALDAPLAVDLAWTCLAGEHDPSMAAPRPLDRVESGALLYLAARTVWALWGKDGPLRVTGTALVDELDSLPQGSVSAHLTLRAGGCAGHAWLILPPDIAGLLEDTRREPSTQESLDRIPAMIHVCLGRGQVSLAELIGARPGDALLLDQVWARPGGAEAFKGELRLRLPRGAPRWAGAMTEPGRIRVERELASEQERAVMDQSDESLPSNPGELLSEIPAEISVELGRVALTAREAVALQPGQTLRLDRRPGDPVELRIGPKLVARGELVEVDGDLGVLLRQVYDRKG